MQYIRAYKKDIAIDLRKRGFSYSEIEDATHVPKSTIAYWVRGVLLDKNQIKKLNARRSQVAIANAKNKVIKRRASIEEIKNSSAKNIGKISKRELWLMGIIMYWKERLILKDKPDLYKGVSLSSSDEKVIKFFLKWLIEIGGIERDGITFDIVISKNKKSKIQEVIKHWSEVTGFRQDYFAHIYYRNQASGKRKHGFVRIRVKASSLLARQINGWMRGILTDLTL